MTLFWHVSPTLAMYWKYTRPKIKTKACPNLRLLAIRLNSSIRTFWEKKLCKQKSQRKHIRNYSQTSSKRRSCQPKPLWPPIIRGIDWTSSKIQPCRERFPWNGFCKINSSKVRCWFCWTWSYEDSATHSSRRSSMRLTIPTNSIVYFLIVPAFNYHERKSRFSSPHLEELWENVFSYRLRTLIAFQICRQRAAVMLCDPRTSFPRLIYSHNQYVNKKFQ